MDSRCPGKPDGGLEVGTVGEGAGWRIYGVGQLDDREAQHEEHGRLLTVAIKQESIDSDGWPGPGGGSFGTQPARSGYSSRTHVECL